MARKIEVKPGQVWQDRDKRMNGRCVRVQRFETKQRWVNVGGMGQAEDYQVAVCTIGATYYETRIAVERMERQQGWLLVRDENGNRVGGGAA